MSATCEKCRQTYEVPEGSPPQCPWCPSDQGKNLPKVPKQIGKYEILEQIGAGGMGVVYRARHIELKNTVALKVMIAGEHASEETLLRFQREARSAAALHHPNIAPVFDVGKEEPLYYIVMEHVEGKNLDQRAQTKITPQEAAQITRDVARALSYAHEHNIVHRDVKPGNILVDKEGRAKLVDFGLAKSLLDDKTLTKTGEIIGTASYMPPEQISGSMREVDEKSDIYSLGTVLYELLSGRTAYAAETLIMTIRQIEEATPTPPSELNKEVPRELETICFKAMAKEKSRRYATAVDLREDLDRFLNGEPIEARRNSIIYRTTKWIQKRPARSTATAMSLLLIMITATLLFRPTPGPTQEEQDKVLFQKALPHLETAQYEIEKASRYTADARQERRSVLEKAVEELNKAIVLFPRYADAFFYRGIARKSLARPDLAQKDFSEAIRLDPTHA
ncbi:MAG: protein kinase, partial [Planctomycetota bacterium]|nr:protein kinase [Planctomycetota bacterium]